MKKKLFVFTTLLISVVSLAKTTPIALEPTDDKKGGFIVKNGKFLDANLSASLSVQEHFELGQQALEASDWREASKQFRIVTCNFPKSTYAQEAFFYLGVAEFELEEYDFSNEAFSNYIQSKNNPKHFQEAIEYKFNIAQNLANGCKRRFLGTRRLPKWASGRTLALKIYDEVIASLSSHDLAAQALYAKGELHWQLQLYRPAIEDYQLLIKRFPKHELVPDAYVAISNIYLELSAYELQNPDILTFAEMNLKKFRHAFPREERIADVEQDLESIQEIYAKGLYETGRFYERTCHPEAALIYYQNAINQFPETNIAECAKQRIQRLNPNGNT
jgi:outer membrane protein assembly factor BamD (BamD/ComL family)